MDDPLAGVKPTSQYWRAGGKLTPSHSPQTKRGAERLFQTFQNRLIKELRLGRGRTLEIASRFRGPFSLECHIPLMGLQFAVKNSTLRPL